MYDYLLVGAGLFSATFAAKAKRKGKKVLIIDKRSHIGGNCYTKKVKDIHIHRYGAHIFHTSNKKVWDFVNEFTDFYPFVNRPKVSYKGDIYSFPINLFTLYQLWGITTPKEALEKLESVRINIKNPSNLEQWALSQVGKEIYEKFIYGYTKKQWMKEPKELPSFIIKRLPIRLSFNDNYFFDRYQGIPENGYTHMIENMIDGCKIELSTDFFNNKEEFMQSSKKIIYTGRIDEYFDYSMGGLEYRTLKFYNKKINLEDFQGNAVVNYTDENTPYTRIIEHKHFLDTKCDETIISYEYPEIWDKQKTPYYPINTPDNNALAERYKNMSKDEKNVFFGGRLAEYRYYDMDATVASSLSLAKKLLI